MSLTKAIERGKERRAVPRGTKCRPSPPIWFWWAESCHFCKWRGMCPGCKYAKGYVAEQKRRRMKGVEPDDRMQAGDGTLR